jgi:hypothetical protein
MATSSAALPLLVVAPAPQRDVDIVLLSSLGAATEKNDQHLAVPSEIDPIAGTTVDLQFSRTFADRLDVRRIALTQPFDRDGYACGRLGIEAVEPLPERVASIRNVFFNPDHMVPYMLPYRKA